MTEYYLAVCTGGHLIDSIKPENIEIQKINIEEAISGEKFKQSYTIPEKFCLECGGEVRTQCDKCGANIHTEYTGPPYPSDSDIPNFCHGCGCEFPWTSTIEAETQRDGDFIQIDDSEIDGYFYPSLVYEINLCYRVKADSAALVLNRKLLESLIVDIFRSVFTMDRIELFYTNGRTLPLSELIDNMKSERAELTKYVSNLDEGFFRALEDLKYHGDASAHAIEEDPSQENLEAKSDHATDVARLLFRLRQEAKTAHRR